MQNHPNSTFFAKPEQSGGKPERTPLLMDSQNSNQNIKNKNLEYMVSLRRKNRRDIIRNNRFKNVMKVTNQVDPAQAIMQDTMLPGSLQPQFPKSLSHLAKVKDSQRILKIIKDVDQSSPSISDLKSFLDVVKTGERLQKHHAIICLRKLLSNQQNLPIQEAIDYNGVPVLIELAKDTSELHLRLEATWCLANMLSGTTQQTLTLINKNVIQLFEDILEDPYEQIVEQAIWGLGNIIGDSVELRQLIVHLNILNKLIVLLQMNRSKKIQKHIIWCLSNALRQKPKEESFISMKNSVIALITAFKTYDDFEIKNDCLMGVSEYCKQNLLTFFTDDKFMVSLREFYQYIYTQNTDYASIQPQISAVHKILGNITNGDDFDTAKVIDQGYLTDLCVMMRVDDPMCKREICWILSNVAAGTQGQIGSLLNEPNLFDNLVGLLHNSNHEIQRESLWTICNMTKNCSAEQLNYLIQQNIFGVFKEFMQKDRPHKMIVLVLEAIPNMIKRSLKSEDDNPRESPLIEQMYESGIADIICDLQRHESDLIYEKCILILENYFDLEEY